jgi:hypothetical protein
LTRLRVLHREVELTGGGISQIDAGRKIERSADALRVRHHPNLFPSN